jgi:hypothetical protein
MARYKVDHLAANVLEAAVSAIDAVKDDVTKAIHGVMIWRDTAQTFIPSKVLLYLHEGKPRSFDHADFKLDLKLLKTAIPPDLTWFQRNGDPIRDAFIKAHRLKKNLDWWGQPPFVPRLLVAVEIDHVVRPAIKGRIENLDLAAGAAFDLYDGDPSAVTHAITEGQMDKAIHKDLRLKLHTDVQRREFAEICYEDQARRDWLAKLAAVSTRP